MTPPYDPDRHGPRRVVGPGFHGAVHDAVRAIPAGRVASYGDVAAMIGARSVARQVGWALAALPGGSDVPWHRVVTGRGTVARRGDRPSREQIRRLRAEGVAVDDAGRIARFDAIRIDGAPPPDRAAGRAPLRTRAPSRRRSTR